MSFLDELKRAKEQGDSERESDYKTFLQKVKDACKAEAFKGRNRWQETSTTARTGDSLLPGGFDLRAKYLARLKDDLHELDVKTNSTGDFLDISWPEVK